LLLRDILTRSEEKRGEERLLFNSFLFLVFLFSLPEGNSSNNKTNEVNGSNQTKKKKIKKRNNKPKKFLRPTRRRETEIVQHKEVVKVEKREKSII
jgi:hypothetical protein